jgi:outer membrane protein assembly factor BamD
VIQRLRLGLVAPVLLALVASLVGCAELTATGPGASLTYTEDARLAYDEAMAAFRDKRWEDARSMFGEVQKLFPSSRYGRLAELRLADVEFEQEKYSESVSAYREWIINHRIDPDVEYAKYRITKALFLGVDDTVLLPPTEERDAAGLLDAHRDLKGFLERYPMSRYRAEAAYMLDAVTGRLVRHELYVARYYLDRDVFEAAIARIDYALKSYGGSSLEPEALVLKGETLLKMKKREDARKLFQQVIDVHGGPFATTARAFLDEIGPAAKATP